MQIDFLKRSPPLSAEIFRAKVSITHGEDNFETIFWITPKLPNGTNKDYNCLNYFNGLKSKNGINGNLVKIREWKQRKCPSTWQQSFDWLISSKILQLTKTDFPSKNLKEKWKSGYDSRWIVKNGQDIYEKTSVFSINLSKSFFVWQYATEHVRGIK